MARRPSDAVTKQPDFSATIAERAYFKAQQRGFVPGHELEDWLAAEQELIGAGKPPPKPRKAPARRKIVAAKK